MATTPAMAQYESIKAQRPDCILFYRMGDFFELFGDDATTAHRILGLTLTKRNNGGAGAVPLCGFPHHQLDRYLPKMIEAGYKVAVCEQVEDPKLAKGVVKREIVEVVTPGTSFNEASLDAKSDSLLASVLPCGGDRFALAFLEATTGDFTASEGTSDEVLQELFRRSPRELVEPEGERSELPEPVRLFLETEKAALTSLPAAQFRPQAAAETLKRQFKTESLEAFGLEGREAAQRAAGAVLGYLVTLKKRPMEHVDRILWRPLDDCMVLDPQTLRNLELVKPLNAEDESATLLHVLDRTSTAMGGRLLRRWISHPLLRKEALEARLDAVEELLGDPVAADAIMGILDQIYDLERLNGRVGSGRANGRDLQALGFGLIRTAELQELLAGRNSDLLRGLFAGQNALAERGRKIVDFLADDLPMTLREGGLIRPGASEELDALNESIRDARVWLAGLEARERERTGIPSLKIGFNKVFGYYIEVTNAHKERIPADYIRKQTLVNAERCITPEMKEMEAKILSAEGRINDVEYRLFCELREEVASWSSDLRNAAEAVAAADALLSLADAARRQGYMRPELREDQKLEIRSAFHPVIVANNPTTEFIRNDVSLDPETLQLMLITGPNMAGKSTFLRQTGLVVLMAQIGSFVPAESASVGLVDRIFTRVGASDRLVRGQSTFMVEMVETANILHHATPRSLILLDEIGRGTSTFDGLSLAWAIVETLHDDPERAGKTLFATHYHEITALEESLPRLANFHVTVQESNGELLFLRKVVPGACDSSYGIQVARMAGLPKATIARARRILKRLEEQRLHPLDQEKKLAQKASEGWQQDLFGAPEMPEGEILALEELRKIDPERMSPMQALQFLMELKEHYLGAR